MSRRVAPNMIEGKRRLPWACAPLAAIAPLVLAGCSPIADTSRAADPPAAEVASHVDRQTAVQARLVSSGGARSGAKLSGRVLLKGTPPVRKPINMAKDPHCIKIHGDKPVLDEVVLVGEGGGLQNVFVSVRRGAPKMEYPLPSEPAVLNQDGCMYRPRVQGVRVGQKLLVENSDPVTHNVRSFPVLNRPFNFGQPAKTEPRERVFERPEREIEVQCDFHPWMHAYIFVLDHPFYATSDKDGHYTIEGLPPGEYALESWHEKFGRQRQNVTIADSDVELDFTYKP